MSSAKRQVMVDAAVEDLWELIGDVRRHPEWWPRVEAVQADVLAEGASYRQITKRPLETIETTISIERLDDCHELRLQCVDTGFYADFLLSPAQDGTFVEAEIGMDPKRRVDKLLDPIVGNRAMRRWVEQSLDGLRQVASSARAARQKPRDERGEGGPT